MTRHVAPGAPRGGGPPVPAAGQVLVAVRAYSVNRTPPTHPPRIVADGEYAVAEWTSRATTLDGAPYENDYAVVFHVRDGRIAAVQEYFDTAYAARVLFGQ